MVYLTMDDLCKRLDELKEYHIWDQPDMKKHACDGTSAQLGEGCDRGKDVSRGPFSVRRARPVKLLRERTQYQECV
jgi:hypothetical protein